jgi:hypothetical protein
MAMLWDRHICSSLRREEMIWRERSKCRSAKEEFPFSPLEETKLEVEISQWMLHFAKQPLKKLEYLIIIKCIAHLKDIQTGFWEMYSTRISNFFSGVGDYKNASLQYQFSRGQQRPKKFYRAQKKVPTLGNEVRKSWLLKFHFSPSPLTDLGSFLPLFSRT